MKRVEGVAHFQSEFLRGKTADHRFLGPVGPEVAGGKGEFFPRRVLDVSEEFGVRADDAVAAQIVADRERDRTFHCRVMFDKLVISLGHISRRSFEVKNRIEHPDRDEQSARERDGERRDEG